MAKTEGCVEVGDIIQDNDPRMPQRKLKIIRFEQERAAAPVKAIFTSQDKFPREFSIGVYRIFTDGKPRRYGFSLIRS